MVNYEQSLQFFCQKCNCILKEIAANDYEQCNELCPICGHEITLQVKKQTLPAPQITHFKTAYDLAARLTLGIDKIDNFLNITAQDRVCISGSFAHLVITRLCVRALMPIRSGGFGSQNVVFIDAGNSSDIYQTVNFARQYGMSIDHVLQNIIVGRPFTIYQLAGLIIYELAGIIEKTHTKIIIISDLLAMFVQDPQISQHEVSYILSEIVKSLANITDDILIVLSLHEPSQHDDKIVSQFNKSIMLESDGKQVNINLRNNQKTDCFSMPERNLRLVQTK